MKTPKKYSDLVNQNKITEEILGEVIYSINKRAKNWRNQKRKYKNYLLDQYDSYDNAVDNEKKYYKMKSDMLEKFEPIKIHKELRFRNFQRKVSEKDLEYNQLDDSDIFRKEIKTDRATGEKVMYKLVRCKLDDSLYYLYYEIGGYTFHQPIEKSELENFKDLKIDVLEDFETFGRDTTELLSVQFCKKVYEKFMDNKLEIV